MHAGKKSNIIARYTQDTPSEFTIHEKSRNSENFPAMDAENDDLIAQFVSVTGASPADAAQYLEV